MKLSAAQYRALREQWGLTQGELAQLLGICLRQGQRYESGALVIPQMAVRLLWMFKEHGLPSDGRKTDQ